MSDRTKISYIDATWNPPCIYTHPCRPASPGCKKCFAKRQLSRNLIKRPANPDILSIPFRWKIHRTILVPSMGELFSPSFSYDDILVVFNTMVVTSWHKYLLLTKHPDRLQKFILKSSREGHQYVNARNIYYGISAENQHWLDKRLSFLFEIYSSRYWLSLEPLLGPIVIPPESLKKIDYVVIGCETGPGHRHCNLVWIAKIVRQCKEAGIKRHVKQIELTGKVNYDLSEWPEELRSRDRI